MAKTDILMLIKTNGLEFDDRLRKESQSIYNLGENIEIVVLEDKNEKETGKTNGIKYNSISLYFRRLLPQKKGLIFKTLEMYMKFITKIIKTKPKIVWIHNVELAGLIPLLILLKKVGYIKSIVWDQHELPSEKVFRFSKSIIYILIKNTDKVIVANKERKEYLLSLFNRELENIYVLDNFVDEIFYKKSKQKLPDEIKDKLNKKNYILAQGGGAQGRYFSNLIEAVLKYNDLKLIVVGSYSHKKYMELKKIYGKEIDEKIILTGLVPQIELIKYIDNSVASIVLYDSSKMNNKLCSPNRLYQAISRGIPVIVGNNPPLKSTVEPRGNGIVLKSDGENVNDIHKGIKNLINNYPFYKENALKNKRMVLWENQTEEIVNLIQYKSKVDRLH